MNKHEAQQVVSSVPVGGRVECKGYEITRPERRAHLVSLHTGKLLLTGKDTDVANSLMQRVNMGYKIER